MLNELKKVNGKDHGKSFIAIFMSHGNDGDVLYGADLETININQVRKILNNENTPKLTNCPKLIIWQACRGGTSALHKL
jgi:hypothetical protein